MLLSKKRLFRAKNWYVKIVAFLVLIMLGYSLFYFGVIKKDCKQDERCFAESAKTCKPTKLLKVNNGNYYDYIIYGKRGSTCSMYIKLKRVAPGSSTKLKLLFEGKDMSCKVPMGNLKETDFEELKNFISYCHGELKEAIYEQIINKMYGLIIQNLEEIIQSE